jgi:hypothetical protein
LSSYVKGSAEPRFRFRPVRFGTVIFRRILLVVALIDRRGLAAGSSGWKLRPIGFSESFSRICAMAGEPPSMHMALSTFLTMHGCSTEIAVLLGTRHQGATSSRPPGCDRILATAVLVGISNVPGTEENEKPSQAASGHRVQ